MSNMDKFGNISRTLEVPTIFQSFSSVSVNSTSSVVNWIRDKELSERMSVLSDSNLNHKLKKQYSFDSINDSNFTSNAFYVDKHFLERHSSAI